MKKFTLLLFSFLLISNAILSQENDKELIIGVVADETGYPLSGASVFIKKPYNTSGTVTDENGIFELEMNNEDTLTISYIGHITELKTYSDIKRNGLINLMNLSYDLSGIVVLGKRDKRIGCKIICGGVYIKRVDDTIPISITFQPRDWHYYPNPTKDYIIVNTFEQNGFIRIFSSTGVELQKVQVTEDFVKLNVANLPAGSYFLRYDRPGWGEVIGQFVKLD